jgi:hypothetical protein
MRQHRMRSFALVALVLAPCWGCGSGLGGGGAAISLLPVKGKVTYNGKPLSSGVIYFERDGYGRPATGKLQSDGTYTLGTLKDGDGVVAGTHLVTLGNFDKALAKDRTLAKYATAKSSGLTAQVDSEHTEFNFDLK